MFQRFLLLLTLGAVAGCSLQDAAVDESAPANAHMVQPVLETTPDESSGDAADDPAI